MKRCFRCGVSKPLSDFYPHKEMSDGHLNKCKCCTRAYTKDRAAVLSSDMNWIESEKERSRAKYHRLGYKTKHKPTAEAKRGIMERYKDKYPEKNAAKMASSPVIKGKERHHWSYKEEHRTDVIHLTTSEHARLHRFLAYDQSVFMYRDKSGNLLDTREKHEQYARFILEKT